MVFKFERVFILTGLAMLAACIMIPMYLFPLVPLIMLINAVADTFPVSTDIKLVIIRAVCVVWGVIYLAGCGFVAHRSIKAWDKDVEDI